MLAENYWKINGFQYHNKHIHEFEQKSEKTPLIVQFDFFYGRKLDRNRNSSKIQ